MLQALQGGEGGDGERWKEEKKNCHTQTRLVSIGKANKRMAHVPLHAPLDFHQKIRKLTAGIKIKTCLMKKYVAF